jgi:hypothetical protein
MQSAPEGSTLLLFSGNAFPGASLFVAYLSRNACLADSRQFAHFRKFTLFEQTDQECCSLIVFDYFQLCAGFIVSHFLSVFEELVECSESASAFHLSKPLGLVAGGGLLVV